MPMVTFSATPEVRTWKHRPGGWQVISRDGTTYRQLVEPHFMTDGETVEMDGSQTDWVLSIMPMNFKLAE